MLCYRKFMVAEKSMEQKWGGGVSKFSVENFCLNLPNYFVEEPF